MSSVVSEAHILLFWYFFLGGGAVGVFRSEPGAQSVGRRDSSQRKRSLCLLYVTGCWGGTVKKTSQPLRVILMSSCVQTGRFSHRFRSFFSCFYFSTTFLAWPPPPHPSVWTFFLSCPCAHTYVFTRPPASILHQIASFSCLVSQQMDDLGKLQIIAPWQEGRVHKIKKELMQDRGGKETGRWSDVNTAVSTSGIEMQIL